MDGCIVHGPEMTVCKRRLSSSLLGRWFPAPTSKAIQSVNHQSSSSLVLKMTFLFLGETSVETRSRRVTLISESTKEYALGAAFI